MNVYTNTLNNQSFGKKLVPLSKYKGPILELTEKEKTEIAKLSKELSKWKIELVNTMSKKERYYAAPKSYSKYERKIERCENYIKFYQKSIDKIKQNRLNVQKEALGQKVNIQV